MQKHSRSRDQRYRLQRQWPVDSVPDPAVLPDWHRGSFRRSCRYHSKTLAYLLDSRTLSIGLEYAYTTSPRTFQGIIMGLYAAIEGLGSFLSVLLVIVTRALHLEWIRSEANFNQGHIDYFFYLLAIIQSFAIIVLGLVIYIRCKLLYYQLKI